MDVVVNGTDQNLDGSATVADVVTRFCDSADGIAVARNGEVVPKSAWGRTTLGSGDRLEIVTAAAGG